MIGSITMDEFGYGFGDAMVQTAPGAKPVAAKLMRVISAEGLEVTFAFIGGEQWEEFQRQVAEQTAPSDIVIAAPGTIPPFRKDGHTLQ